MSKLNLIAGLIGCGLFAMPAIQAQTTAPKYASVTINTTGCLVRADRAHEYSVTDNSGKKFELVPDYGVNMKKHVGQNVMITGTETMRKRGEREGVQYLRVDQVKRIDDGSSSCSR